MDNVRLHEDTLHSRPPATSGGALPGTADTVDTETLTTAQSTGLLPHALPWTADTDASNALSSAATGPSSAAATTRADRAASSASSTSFTSTQSAHSLDTDPSSVVSSRSDSLDEKPHRTPPPPPLPQTQDLVHESRDSAQATPVGRLGRFGTVHPCESPDAMERLRDLYLEDHETSAATVRSVSFDSSPGLSTTPHVLEPPANIVSDFQKHQTAKTTDIPFRPARKLSPSELADRLERDDILVVDVRPLGQYLGTELRLRGSININMPSLLLKRFHRGNTSSFSLSGFASTESSKATLDRRLSRALHEDVVVVQDRTEGRDPDSLDPGTVLLSVLERQADLGQSFYLEETLNQAAQAEPRLQRWMVQGETSEERDVANSREAGLPTIQTSSSNPRLTFNASSPGYWAKSPATPSTPGLPPTTPPRTPGSTGRPRPRLKRIDTSEDLLSPRSRASSASSVGAKSHVPALRVDPDCANNSNHNVTCRTPDSSVMSVQSICHIQSRSPGATRLYSDESHAAKTTALSDPTDEPPPDFDVSTIIDGSLYLGPEPTKLQDLDDLERRGVRVVLNLAVECEDLDGLVASRFELRKVPMRDFVEETGVQKSFESACRILTDAQLKSKPVYCHCRAGKSRSVAVVLAYLVQRNHWSLQASYAHVSDRRPGISPNIGFVSELMKWEERQRGSKSGGVLGSTAGGARRDEGGVGEDRPTAKLHLRDTPSNGESSSMPASAVGSFPDDAREPSLRSETAFSAPLQRSGSDQGVFRLVPDGRSRGHVGRSSSGFNDTEQTPGLPAPRTEASLTTTHLSPSPPATSAATSRSKHRDYELEVRSRDGTWTAARSHGHSAESIATRRASRAGLESVF